MSNKHQEEAVSDLERFITRRKSIIKDMDALHPDWKHHVSFLKLAEAVQVELGKTPSKPEEKNVLPR